MVSSVNNSTALTPFDLDGSSVTQAGGQQAIVQEILEMLEEIMGQQGSAGAPAAGDSGSPGEPQVLASDGGGDSSAGGSTGANGGPLPQNLQKIANEVDPSSGQTYGQIVNADVNKANANGAHLTDAEVLATIDHESSGNPNAKGDITNGQATSFGLMQINNNDAANTSGPYAGQNQSSSIQTQIGMGTEDLANLSKQYSSPEQMFEAYETGGDANATDGYGQESVNLMNGNG